MLAVCSGYRHVVGVDSHVVGADSWVVGVDMYWQLGSGC